MGNVSKRFRGAIWGVGFLALWCSASAARAMEVYHVGMTDKTTDPNHVATLKELAWDTVGDGDLIILYQSDSSMTATVNLSTKNITFASSDGTTKIIGPADNTMHAVFRSSGSAVVMDHVAIAGFKKEGGAAEAGRGGNWYNSGGTQTLEGPFQINNGSVKATAAGGGQGGGLYSAGNFKMTNDSGFSGNAVDGVGFADAGQGGALYVRGDLAAGNNNWFTGNRAETSAKLSSGAGSVQGGGAYVTGDAAFGSGNKFSGNSAEAKNAAGGARGGGLYAGGDAKFGNGAILSSNTVELAKGSDGAWGGAVYAGGNVSVGHDATMVGNLASASAVSNGARGAGVYAAGTARFGDRARVTGNEASGTGAQGGVGQGGAVYANNAVFGSETVLRGNHAVGGSGGGSGRGGAVHARVDATFGAASAVSDNFAQAASGNGSAQGGAVYAGRDVKAGDGSVLSGNTVSLTSASGTGIGSGQGGAVYAGRNGTFGNRVELTGNSAAGSGDNSGSGGAVYAGTNATFGNAASVVDNQASSASGVDSAWGGGVAAKKGNIVLGEASTVARNSAKTVYGDNAGLGGGLYAGGTVAVGSESMITQNQAVGGRTGTVGARGGGVYAGRGATFGQGAQLVGNQATGRGGADSAQGGGLYVAKGNASFGDGVKVANNTAQGAGAGSAQGGGVMAADGEVTFGKKATVTGNSAKDGGVNGSRGGGLYAADGAAFGDGAVISQNLAESAKGANAGQGGGAYVDAGPFYAGANARIENNKALGAGNDSALGGGVAARLGDINLGKNAVLTGNIAQAESGARAGAGGALYSGNDVALGASSLVYGNTARGSGVAGGQGGGLYAAHDLSLGNDTRLAGNNAVGSGTNGGQGGGAWVGGNADLYGGVTVSGNRADQKGGGLYVAGAGSSRVTLNADKGDIVFQANHAAGKSNAIYFENRAGNSVLSTVAAAGRTVDFRDPISGNAANGNLTVTTAGSGTTRFATYVSDVVADTTVEGGTFWIDDHAVYGGSDQAGSFTVNSGATLKVDVDLAADRKSANGHGVIRAGAVSAENGAKLALSGSAPSAAKGQELLFKVLDVAKQGNIDVKQLRVDNPLLTAYFDPKRDNALVVRSRDLSKVYDVDPLADLWRVNPHLTDAMRDYLNDLYNNGKAPGKQFDDFLGQLSGQSVMNALHAQRVHLDDLRQNLRWRTSDFHLMSMDDPLAMATVGSTLGYSSGPIPEDGDYAEVFGAGGCGAPSCPRPCDDTCPRGPIRGAFWVAGTQHMARQKDHDGMVGYEYDPTSVALGYDRRIGDNLLVGAAAQYGWGAMDSNDGGLTTNDLDSLLLAAYASFAAPRWYADAGVQGGWGWNKTRTYYPMWNESTTGKYDSYAVGANAEVGLIFPIDDGCGEFPLFIMPHVGGALSYHFANSFRESGNRALTRRFDDQDWLYTEVPVGIKFAKSFQSGCIRWTPEVDFTYAYQFGRTAPRGSVELIGVPGQDWSIAGEDSGRHIGRIDLGVRANIKERVELMAHYDLELRRRYYDHRFRAGMAVGF